jgi:hypothetical protein
MLIALVVPRLAAQQATPPVYQVLPPVVDGGAKADSAQPVQAQLPCPDCNPGKHGLRGFGELMIVQAVPSVWNNVRRGEVWAKISPRTWYDNIQYPWQWDDNAFPEQPVLASPPRHHGNLYYNSGRANGYNFWASAPWAFGGSLMWELLGESWAPSPNDLLNTNLGGIAPGEMTYRLSSLTLDNTATGIERTAREALATLINPIRGFNRLIEGKMGPQAQNPAEWRPDFIEGALDVGYRRIGDAGAGDFSDDVSSDGGYVMFKIFHGSLMRNLTNKPFSRFQVQGEVASKKAQNESRRLSTLNAMGSLGGVALKGTKQDPTQALAAFMRYDYFSNPAVAFGGQSFRGGWIGLFGDREKFSMRLETLASFFPISALRSDYFITEEGRDYDYGMSLGGEKSQHTIGGGSADLRVMITRAIGLGASYYNYHRWSRYVTQPDVDQNSPSFRVYVGLALPSVHSN